MRPRSIWRKWSAVVCFYKPCCTTSMAFDWQYAGLRVQFHTWRRWGVAVNSSESRDRFRLQLTTLGKLAESQLGIRRLIVAQPLEPISANSTRDERFSARGGRSSSLSPRGIRLEVAESRCPERIWKWMRQQRSLRHRIKTVTTLYFEPTAARCADVQFHANEKSFVFYFRRLDHQRFFKDVSICPSEKSEIVNRSGNFRARNLFHMGTP